MARALGSSLPPLPSPSTSAARRRAPRKASAGRHVLCPSLMKRCQAVKAAERWQGLRQASVAPAQCRGTRTSAAATGGRGHLRTHPGHLPRICFPHLTLRLCLWIHPEYSTEMRNERALPHTGADRTPDQKQRQSTGASHWWPHPRVQMGLALRKGETPLPVHPHAASAHHSQALLHLTAFQGPAHRASA